MHESTDILYKSGVLNKSSLIKIISVNNCIAFFFDVKVNISLFIVGNTDYTGT